MRTYFVSFQASFLLFGGGLTTTMGSQLICRDKPISSNDDIDEITAEIQSKYRGNLELVLQTKNTPVTISIMYWRRMEDPE
jgi:hypothetical protein